MTTSESGLWDYRDGEAIGDDSVGYSVEASDGGIGKVDEASTVVGSSYIVVDTGPWIFGKKVMLPAGLIGRVDRETKTVYVNKYKGEIKDSPEFDETQYQESAYQDELGMYYGGRPAAGGTGSDSG